ncbi:hypothetical protein B7494_g1932 [Chlorociboria aeruginascens]|nr:hypothetical protein B7494_g1932 [Chlorociboria aeruginascens]
MESEVPGKQAEMAGTNDDVDENDNKTENYSHQPDSRSLQSPTPEELTTGVLTLFKPDRQSNFLFPPVPGAEIRDVYCIKWSCPSIPVGSASLVHCPLPAAAMHAIIRMVPPALYEKSKHVMDMAAEYNAGRHSTLGCKWPTLRLTWPLKTAITTGRSQLRARPWVPVQNAVSDSTNSLLSSLQGLCESVDRQTETFCQAVNEQSAVLAKSLMKY